MVLSMKRYQVGIRLCCQHTAVRFSRVEPNYMRYESEKDLPLYFEYDMNRVLI